MSLTKASPAVVVKGANENKEGNIASVIDSPEIPRSPVNRKTFQQKNFTLSYTDRGAA
jgi:hypothetical protein